MTRRDDIRNRLSQTEQGTGFDDSPNHIEINIRSVDDDGRYAGLAVRETIERDEQGNWVTRRED